MKKILFAVVAFILSGVAVVKADNDKIINKSELPAQAQQFINEHFSGVKLSYAGTGTQRVVSDLQKLYPTARILRMDKR